MMSSLLRLNTIAMEGQCQHILAEWDEEGVIVYQAYCREIADYALEHQRLGGPAFKTQRMTWIKPSFGWMLYRSGYGHKPGQERVLRIKLTHQGFADILSQCRHVSTNKAEPAPQKHRGEGGGRVQWDPDRDLHRADRRVPRRMYRRAIQIGVSGALSQLYNDSIVSIEDVSELAHRVGDAHRMQRKASTLPDDLLADLPIESMYEPRCSETVLERLALRPGEVADSLQRLGKGKAHS
eukprot:m.358583 g.358583  ORF g.358583 m.358583 type:complete len:238 (-) comp18190_c0_seq1:1421-2134(-)